MSRPAKPRKRELKASTLLGSELTVIAPIDSGGVEPVYLVWNHRDWCPMACKIMLSAANATQEAAVLRQFAHPNILQCYGVHNDTYLLMPFVEGTTLASLIDDSAKRRLTLADSIRIAIYAGAALIHVHERGFVHLDVKPGNIILGADGRPVLFDFGTARRTGEERPDEVIGTNLYIAPEECKLGNPGAAADIFSWAVMLYEMLTGEFPFGKPSATTPFPQIRKTVTPIRRYRPTVPSALENLVFACLERDPAYRPEFSEILPQLHNFLDRGPPMWPAGLVPGLKRGGERVAALQRTAKSRCERADCVAL